MAKETERKHSCPHRKRPRVVADTPTIAAMKQALFSLMEELNRFL